MLAVIYAEILELKREAIDEEREIEHTCIIIDDFANDLKNKDIAMQLNKMIIKARHLACSFIFTLQSYFYFPKLHHHYERG